MMANLHGGDHAPVAAADGVTRRVTLAGTAAALMSGALASCSTAKQARAATANDAPTTRRLTVRSESMEPTIVKGQPITIDVQLPGTYKPRRQDIVAVYPTAEYQGMQQTDLMIRRVIGIPGDTVSCDGWENPLMLNGTALSEPYLHKGDAPSAITFDVKIPPGHLWLLGDHRAIAIDCRYHLADPDHGAFPVFNVAGIYVPNA